MGIDLSLRLTPHHEPAPRGPEDQLVAWARGFVPIAWWTLFSPGDAAVGPRGLALITRTDAALERLRRRGPELRAAAGRHALGLRAIDAALRGAPARFLRAELHELYEGAPGDLASLCDPAPLAISPSKLERGRILATRHHGGDLADAVVGAVADREVDLPEPATLESRSLTALRTGDSSDLDSLEEALARPLADALAPWRSMTRRRWGDGRADAAADEVLAALVEGRPDPFAPLARTYAHFAAYALAEAAGRAHARQRALRRALRGATHPLAAPLALILRVACPSLDALHLAEWLDGGPPPRTVASREAVLACRLASVGAPAWPLSLYDPVAWVERALAGDLTPPDRAITRALAAAPDLAVARALALPAERARSWLAEDARDDALLLAARHTAAALCTSALTLDPPTRAMLRDLPAPQAPFLTGAARACVLLALGDRDLLPALLADDATHAGALVAALRSAGASDHALDWLAERTRGGDLAAATLVLDTPTADAAALTAARACAAPALRRVAEIRSHYEEGLVTTAERDAVLAELAELARALGPDGAPLQTALRA